MAYDIAPLKSYVRFYLAIVSQLERVWQSLVSIETAMRDELGPFAPDLEGVPLTAIATLTDPPRELPVGPLAGVSGMDVLRALADLGFENLHGVDPLITARQSAEGVHLLLEWQPPQSS